ncbi:alanine racemase [Alteromonas sp. H39]|uniref:alanine racemase n=1 Tax=Alteromonas sp. H39 TaxID=3389876 RepID=UPI0039E1B5CB
MSEHVKGQGTGFRPHVKTLKSLQAALYYAPPDMPITVSTLVEAQYFANAGYRDILYAVTLTPNKLAMVESLLDQGVQLTVLIDSADACQMLEFQWQSSFSLPVAIEVDVDDHRAGLKSESNTLVDVAQRLANAERLEFAGVVAHAGASYGCFTESARIAMAQQEVARVQQAVSRIAEAGLACAMVSIGSTPTALANVSRDGITELRAGVYATFDCVMAGLGVCRFDDIAMSVLTTVIGTQPEKGQILIDAGWMALSRDKGTASHDLDCGYGLVCDEHGNILEGWRVSQTNQEHGIITHMDDPDASIDAFSYGQRLRILPVHACATAAQFSSYYVITGSAVSETWTRINGW